VTYEINEDHVVLDLCFVVVFLKLLVVVDPLTPNVVDLGLVLEGKLPLDELF